jgi:hypothetical protein
MHTARRGRFLASLVRLDRVSRSAGLNLGAFGIRPIRDEHASPLPTAPSSTWFGGAALEVGDTCSIESSRQVPQCGEICRTPRSPSPYCPLSV